MNTRKETATMNTRLLGTLCIAGSVVGLADAVRLVMLGRPLASGLQQLDSATDVATAVGALGGLCGLLGLMALRATGNNPIFRLLGYLPAISYLAAVVGSMGLLFGVLTNDSDNPVTVLIWLVSDLLGPAAWLALAILTVAARRLQGWRRLVPFAIVLAFPVGIVVTEITGLAGTFRIVAYAVLVLLGYAVQRAEPAPRLREALA
jgi:hypothetical protein